MPVIDHVVVLVLENRSFDHLLGYLRHPDPRFDGLQQSGSYVSTGWKGSSDVAASTGAKPVLPVGPDHSHDAVMQQLGAKRKGPDWEPNNKGFVESYEAKARGLAVPTYGGFLRRLIALFGRLFSHVQPSVKNRGPLVMLCHEPSDVPALSELALQFAVCTRWFSSVPGETWPNRNFMHAATSDGETNIYPRLYNNKTIFQVLERVGRTWHIYHDDTPQVWAFRNLWATPERRANWFEIKDFAKHVADGSLPNYSFIEPNHRPPLHMVSPDEPTLSATDISNNQHPENSLIRDEDYDRYSSSQSTDFARADQLIATVYEALRQNRSVFERTVLLVTYDEHGGLYDHVPPPSGAANPASRPGLVARILRSLFYRKSAPFDFTLLGVRVPAIVISPFIPAGTVDPELHDHASVPATLRQIFIPKADPLGPRDEAANPFHHLLTLPAARTGAALPDLSTLVPHPVAAEPATQKGLRQRTPVDYQNFVKLAKAVDRGLKQQGLSGAGRLLFASRRQKAQRVTQAFIDEAERQRPDTQETT